jgi:membrane-anchored glycerophosphoryl diester phosphodiesterase (GDPDase)
MIDGWTVAWIFWVAMFFVIEIPALINKTQGDTLSEHIRKWFSTTDKTRWWIARRAVLVLAMIWFLLHLFIPYVSHLW